MLIQEAPRAYFGSAGRLLAKGVRFCRSTHRNEEGAPDCLTRLLAILVELPYPLAEDWEASLIIPRRSRCSSRRSLSSGRYRRLLFRR